MLLPALAKAKESARRIKCLNNLRQWGLAQTMYVDENGDTYPMTKIPNGTAGAPPGYNEDNPYWADLFDFYYQQPSQGNDAWFNALPRYVAQQPLSADAIQQAGTGIDSYNNNSSIFKCPSAKIDPGVDVYKRVAFQYGMNSKGLDGLPSTVVYLKGPMVVSPSKFVLFDEGRTLVQEKPFYGNVQKQTDICKPQVYTPDFSSRHNSGGCITFADGHTAWFRYSYVCKDAGAKAADPGDPDIQWACDGHVVP
jgi:prepilin-type processing-associated H-X9-DG protein